MQVWESGLYEMDSARLVQDYNVPCEGMATILSLLPRPESFTLVDN
jgi:hypothetical protein